jgi:hypothetical protein
MGATDVFPLDPDFEIPEEGEDGVARTPALSAAVGQRIVTPDPRVWNLVFEGRSTDEVEQLRDWWARFKNDHFIFQHKVWVNNAGTYLVRKFPVIFGGRPRARNSGPENYALSVHLIEAVGRAMQSGDYPDPAAGHPTYTIEEDDALGRAAAAVGTWTSANLANASAGKHRTNPNTNTTDKFRFTYTGYGFQIFSIKDSDLGQYDVLLDGADVGDVDLYNPTQLAAAAVFNKLDVPLGMHTVDLLAKNAKNASSSANTIVADALKAIP